MGAFKDLNSSDVFLTDYVARKQWSVSPSSFDALGIKVMSAESGSYPYYVVTGSMITGSVEGVGYYPRLAYSSLNQCFYSGSSVYHVSGSEECALRADLNMETTIEVEGSRTLPAHDVWFISIPRKNFGVQIEKESVTISYIGGVITDKEGVLFDKKDSADIKTVAGDVIYSKGLLIITSNTISSGSITNISWTSNLPIFTYNVKCNVHDLEFNTTTNPTCTDLSINPYVTSVGLYNNVGELLAVAKLSKPIKKALDTDMVFPIRIDIS